MFVSPRRVGISSLADTTDTFVKLAAIMKNRAALLKIFMLYVDICVVITLLCCDTDQLILLIVFDMLMF